MQEMLAAVMDTASYVVPFLVVLGIVVFVHEFGHFWVARRCGVKIETFSIGFGPEIYAWHDRLGTRWRVAWMPLGGYVKMFGDSDPSSFGPDEKAKQMSEAEKKVAFYSQSLPKRFAIVAAGPGSNYLFAVVLLALLYVLAGQPYTSNVISDVVEGSVAQKAGLLKGDKVLAIDEVETESFEDIRRIVSLNNGTPVTLSYERDNARMTLELTPELLRSKDRFGGEHMRGQIGIVSTKMEMRDLGLARSLFAAGREVVNITTGTLKGVGQIIMGIRGADELGGPLRIAEMSGKVAQDGFTAFVWFIVVISVNLGLINLFPVPLLDGGHLLFYLAEAVRGRPLGDRVQEYGARLGAFLVVSLMVFATWNDLVHLQVVSYVRSLFS